MSLYDKIVSIYPALNWQQYDWAEGDILLQNDGNGDYIAKWEHPTLARPTDEQLEAAGQ